MEAKNLRVTNLVYNDRIVNAVIFIGFDSVQLITPQGNNITARLDLIKPIPLTDEWLKRADFRFSSKYIQKLLTVFVYFELLEVKDGYNCYLTQKGKREIQFVFRKIKYVHELQNIYFALTGSELVFSEA